MRDLYGVQSSYAKAFDSEWISDENSKRFGYPVNYAARVQRENEYSKLAHEKKVRRLKGYFANGGPVQDMQAKGFVPVRVSNGEFEFTPEQVANIGAAVLANGGGKAQPPMGLDSMG